MRLEQSLDTGEGFASSVIAHTESCLREFDQGYAGISICDFIVWMDDHHIVTRKLPFIVGFVAIWIKENDI